MFFKVYPLKTLSGTAINLCEMTRKLNAKVYMRMSMKLITFAITERPALRNEYGSHLIVKTGSSVIHLL